MSWSVVPVVNAAVSEDIGSLIGNHEYRLWYVW